MTFIATFIVLAVAGIIDAGYLYYSHRSKKTLVCPLDGDYNRVSLNPAGPHSSE